MDAIIISDSGASTYSASSPLRFHIDEKLAFIQHVRNFLEHGGRIVHPVRGEEEKNWRVAPKLNGIYLYNYLDSEGFESVLIDSYYQERDRFKELLKEKPLAIVISTTFIINKKDLTQLIENIRSIAPDAFIIAGGPFVYSSYLLKQREVDKDYDVTNPQNDYLFLNSHGPDIDMYIADRDGLQVLGQVLTQIKNDQTIDNIPNTIKWDGNVYSYGPREELPLTRTPILWERLPEDIFASEAANVQASIGCPFQCEFCNFVKEKRHTYIKPLDELFDELKAISARGIKYVRFVDDNFRLGRSDLDDVCRRFIDEGLDLKWMSFIRASTLDRSDLDLLKKAGCIEVQIGIESADKTVLKNMKKHADTEMYQRVIARLLAKGINCSCCFLVGFPGETDETFQRTVDFIESISREDQDGIFFWSIYPFVLFPLSPIYEASCRAHYGLTGYMNKWEHNTMNSHKAQELITKAFLQIESAGPIYSGDNIEMLLELSPEKRKAFMRTRHHLAKQLLSKPFDPSLVLDSFSRVLE